MTSVDRTRNAEREHLVVALPHAATVKRKLKDLGVEWDHKREDSDARLGLALLPLERLDRWQHGLPDRAELTEYITAARLAAAVADVDISALDLLMVKLRRSFAERHAGWIPLLGKDRDVHSVTSYPEISGGRPKPASVEPPRRAAPFPLPGPYRRGRGVRVGVLDTPLYAHPDLAGRYLASGAVFADSPEARPMWLGHATFIASVIMRHAPEAELDIRSVFSDIDATTTTWNLARRMVDFAGSGIDVLNLSLGCLARDRQPPMVLARAVQLLSPDIVIVAAAGNHGGSRDPSPIDGPAYP